jgi:hypothetical protein
LGPDSWFGPAPSWLGGRISPPRSRRPTGWPPVG